MTWMRSETSSSDSSGLGSKICLLFILDVAYCRLAGIEEDEDLVTVCVSDIRLTLFIEYMILVYCTIYRDAVDEEGDGDISKDEFVKNAMKSKFIFNMLKE